MIEAFTRQHVAPLMRENGFKKRGLRWNRVVAGGIVHVVEVQASQWNDDDSHSFTLNYGTWVKQLWTILWDNAPPQVVGEEDCFPRFRIGDLSCCSTTDLWWSLEDVPRDELAESLENLLVHEVLTHLDACRTLEEVFKLADKAREWRHPAERLSYAILCHLTNRHGLSESIISELAADGNLVAWRARIGKVRGRLTQSD